MPGHTYRRKTFFPDDLPVSAIRKTEYPEDFLPGQVNTREFWKITLIESGTGFLVTNGCRIPVSSGSAYLSRPEDLTRYEMESPLRLINVLILPPFMKKILQGLFRNDTFFSALGETPPEHPFPLRICSDALFRRLIRQILSELKHMDANTLPMLEALLRGILIEFDRQFQLELYRQNSRNAIRELEHFLQEHFREKIVMRDLAEQFSFAPGTLFTRFRKETGKTIGGYLTELRLQQALLLLQKQKKYSNTRIARECGFSSPNQFYLCFRRRFSCTPGTYHPA